MSMFKQFIKDRKEWIKTFLEQLPLVLLKGDTGKFFSEFRAPSCADSNQENPHFNFDDISLKLNYAVSYADFKFRLLKLKDYLPSEISRYSLDEITNDINKLDDARKRSKYLLSNIIDNFIKNKINNTLLSKEDYYQKNGMVKVLSSKLNSCFCPTKRIKPSIEITIQDFYTNGGKSVYFIVDGEQFVPPLLPDKTFQDVAIAELEKLFEKKKYDEDFKNYSDEHTHQPAPKELNGAAITGLSELMKEKKNDETFRNFLLKNEHRKRFIAQNAAAVVGLSKLFKDKQYDKTFSNFLLNYTNRAGFMGLLHHFDSLAETGVTPHLLEWKDINELSLCNSGENPFIDLEDVGFEDAEGIKFKKLNSKKVQLERKITYYGIKNLFNQCKLFEYPIVLRWCLTVEMSASKTFRFSDPRVFITVKQTESFIKNNVRTKYSFEEEKIIREIRNSGIGGYDNNVWEMIMESRKGRGAFSFKTIDLFNNLLLDHDTITELYGEDVYLASQIIKQGFAFGGARILKFENDQKMSRRAFVKLRHLTHHLSSKINPLSK